MQQLRVVRLLPNGIESAKHKMNSSPCESVESTATRKWNKLDIIKEKERERKPIYKVWNYIKHSRAVKEPICPLFERDEITNRKEIYFPRIDEREKWKFFFFFFFFSFETTENVCRKNTVVIMIMIRTCREYRFLLGMRNSSSNNLSTTELPGSINIRLKIYSIFWYSPM